MAVVGTYPLHDDVRNLHFQSTPYMLHGIHGSNLKIQIFVTLDPMEERCLDKKKNLELILIDLEHLELSQTSPWIAPHCLGCYRLRRPLGPLLSLISHYK